MIYLAVNCNYRKTKLFIHNISRNTFHTKFFPGNLCNRPVPRKGLRRRKYHGALSFLNLEIQSHKAHQTGHYNYYWIRCKSIVAANSSAKQVTLRIPLASYEETNVLRALNCSENSFFTPKRFLHSRLETFHFGLRYIHSTLLGIWYISSDWWLMTKGSDVMNTTSHR